VSYKEAREWIQKVDELSELKGREEFTQVARAAHAAAIDSARGRNQFGSAPSRDKQWRKELFS
jgi:hypothetical protein